MNTLMFVSEESTVFSVNNNLMSVEEITFLEQNENNVIQEEEISQYQVLLDFYATLYGDILSFTTEIMQEYNNNSYNNNIQKLDLNSIFMDDLKQRVEDLDFNSKLFFDEIPSMNEYVDTFLKTLFSTFTNINTIENINNDITKIENLKQELYKFESLYNQILIDILNIITLLKEKNFSELEDKIKNNVFCDLAIKLLDDQNFSKGFNESYIYDTKRFTEYKDIIFEFLDSLSITININQSTNNILNEYYKFREILYNDQKLNLWVMHRQLNTDLDFKTNISSDIKMILNEPYNTYFSRYGNLLLGYIDQKLIAEVKLELDSK